jgi:glycosyltransferase involved in cell wall biosynthesis
VNIPGDGNKNIRKENRGRILFIAPQPFFQWRGSPIRVSFDVTALSQAGFTVDLLTLPLGERKNIPGITIHRVPNWFKIKSVPIGPSPSKMFFDILLFLKGIGLCLVNDYKVIHGVEEAGLLAVILSKIAGAKVVFEKHSDPASYKAGTFSNRLMEIYANIERFCVRHSNAVIATGKGLVQQVRSIKKHPNVYHIFDIPSSLAEADLEKTQKQRKSLQQKSEEILITYAGSFAAYQGIDIMFAAIEYVCKHSSNARFIIIGGSKTEITERCQKLDKEGVSGQVNFIGKVAPEELPDYLAASDILLSPRLSGTNTPLKLLDYLKAGRAIVATSTTANRQILDQSNAVLVNTDAKSFAEGILLLINNRNKREELSKTGKELITQKYNFNEFSRRLNDCYSYIEQL